MFYERYLDDLHIRDAFDLSNRGVYDLHARGNKFHAGDVEFQDHRYQWKLSRRSGTPPSRPTSPRPASLSSSRGPSRPLSPQSNVDSVEFDPSEGSTESAVYLGMTRYKTSKEKLVKVVGVNGCTAVFLSGHDRSDRSYITGLHADPLNFQSVIFAAAQQAKAEGTVTEIVIYAPDDVGEIDWVYSHDFVKAHLNLEFPNIHPTEVRYRYMPNFGYWNFFATQGHPPHIEMHFIPCEGPTPMNTPVGSPRRHH